MFHREDARIHIPEVISTLKTGRRGRPRKVVDPEFLRIATAPNRRITFTKLAKLLGIHRNTLTSCMKEHGVEKWYSTISNHELDDLVNAFKVQRPESGYRYLVGHLQNCGLRIQRRRIVGALQRVDMLGRKLRNRKVIRRRKYRVKRPNSLWHVDGHHKLIRWGIVIHAFIDGFCRTVSFDCDVLHNSVLTHIKVTGIRASSNNLATTVLDLFLHAIDEYGMPSRGRGDRGGENLLCATYTVLRNGRNRGSFIWGGYVLSMI